MVSKELVDELVLAANDVQDLKVGAQLRDAMSALSERYDEREVRIAVAEALGSINSPLGAGLVGMWLGAGVEKRGLSPSDSLVSLRDALVRWSQSAELNDDPLLDKGMAFLGQAFVLHLLADEGKRLEFAADHELVEVLEAVETDSPGPVWVLHTAENWWAGSHSC
jgi:hypothetical protein